MSLRVTQGNLYMQALQDIRNGLVSFTDLQHQIATGRRVNSPSDDPAGTLRILPLTGELRDLNQMLDNVSLTKEVLDTGSASLQDASEIMQRVRELAVQAANGTLSDGDRGSIAAEIDELLHQMISIGNASRGGRFLFGGTVTDRPPFELLKDAGGSRVTYGGNHDRVTVDVAPDVKTSLNIPGDAIFQARNRGPTVLTGNTGIAASGATDSGVGFQTLNVSFNGLHTDAPAEFSAGTGTTTALGELSYVFTPGPGATLSIGGGPPLPVPATNQDFTTADGRVINLSVSGVPATLSGTFTSKAGLSTDGNATVVDVSDFTDTNVQVLNSHDGTVLNLDVTNLRLTGDEQVEYKGTFDVFTVLISLSELLRNEQQKPPQQVVDRITAILGEVDNAHESVLDGLRELGFRSSGMTLLQGRMENLQASRAESLSRVQDTDMAEAILALQRHDIAYQAALQIGARVIQTSLQGFLR